MGLAILRSRAAIGVEADAQIYMGIPTTSIISMAPTPWPHWASQPGGIRVSIIPATTMPSSIHREISSSNSAPANFSARRQDDSSGPVSLLQQEDSSDDDPQQVEDDTGSVEQQLFDAFGDAASAHDFGSSFTSVVIRPVTTALTSAAIGLYTAIKGPIRA